MVQELQNNLTNRKPDNFDQGRSRMANMMVFKQYLYLLEEKINRLTINRLNLRNKPSLIFNCNESMIAINRRTGKVVISRKTKEAYAETKGTRDHITANTSVASICKWVSFTIPPPPIYLPAGLSIRSICMRYP